MIGEAESVKIEAVVLYIYVIVGESGGLRLLLMPETMLRIATLSGVIEYFIRPQSGFVTLSTVCTVIELTTESK